MGIAGAEGAKSFSQLPALHHTVASFKPEPGSSAGPRPGAELWEFTCGAGSQPCLVTLGDTQGAGCWGLAAVHHLITLLQALGCFLPV